ncbi:MAG: hypothetical protein IPN78_18450 [Candidatus Accumulibacter sp.]|nr:hypothetical protein [Candidatus Accumulibacter propinquus]
MGSEQGFCGYFNEALLARMQALCQDKEALVRLLVVGSRLATRIGECDCVDLAQPGAIVADEVPAVLLRLTRELSGLLAREYAGFTGSALYHGDALAVSACVTCRPCATCRLPRGRTLTRRN